MTTTKNTNHVEKQGNTQSEAKTQASKTDSGMTLDYLAWQIELSGQEFKICRINMLRVLTENVDNM